MFFGNFILILVLIVINGFFVAVEFAVVSARRVRIEALAEEGNKAARIVQAWLENPSARDRLIGAAQLGITIVSLALGAVGENTFEALLEPYFHDLVLPSWLQSLSPILVALPLVLSLIIVTSLHVILGEQVPKVAALHSPERVALLGSRPMQVFSSVFKWFVDILDWATRQILKILGLEVVDTHAFVYTIDELKQIVTESEEGGVIEYPELEMLHAIFDFGELLVRQVMIPRTEFEAIKADTSLDTSIRLATASNYSKFPIYEDDLDNILGIVHIKDMLRAQQDPERQNSLVRSLVREVLFLPETIPVKALLREFRGSRQHIAIVLDEYGGTAGLVTLEDVLEEIVGEVSGPFDAGQPEIQMLPDGSALIDGLTLVEEVNDKLGLRLHDPYYDTIAGYMLGQLGRMAAVNDAVEVGGIRLRVESLDGMRIASLSFARLDANEPVGETGAE